MKAGWIPEAIGASLLLLFPVLAPVVTPGYLFVYHHRLPLTHLLDGLVLDVVGLTVAGVLVLALLPRLPLALRRIIGAGLAGLLLWGFAYDVIAGLRNWSGRDLSELPHPSFLTAVDVWWHRWSVGVAFALALLLSAIAQLRSGTAGRIVRATRVGLRMAAFCALWIIPELVYLDYRSHGESASVASEVEAQTSAKPRIVWILFDELSYKLVLSQPPQGQEFPNFSRLRGESISLGNIEPVGNFTELIIPSLLADRRIRQIRSTPEGSLLYRDEARHEWVAYDAGQTLFAVARERGWNPGVGGWAMPYCRIFGGILTRCFWEPGIGAGLSFEPWAAGGDSAFSYAMALPRELVAKVCLRQQAREVVFQEANRDGVNLMQQGQAMLEDQRVRFVYMHLPVPHPPGVYDRRKHRRCACGNYLDNLTLADDMLGALMKEIDRTGGPGGTTVIVSSDHSWRVPLWKTTPYWSAEEEAVSGGRFDSRPVFMIHFAGQASGSEVLAPLPELVEHDVIAGMLEGRIAGPADVEALVAQPGEVARATLGTQ